MKTNNDGFRWGWIASSCLLLTFMLLSGCGTGDGSVDNDIKTGSIAVRLVWPSPAEWQSLNTRRIAPRSNLPAQAQTVRARVSAADMNALEKDFPAADRRGSIANVPAGSHRSLTLQVLNHAGALLADCEKTGLLLEAGKVTQAGDCVFKVVGDGDTRQAFEPEMVSIPAGSFSMGSPEDEVDRESDERQHSVSVEAFLMGKYEVTNAQFVVFLNQQGRSPDQENQPWIEVQSEDADSRILQSGGTFSVESGFEDHPVIEISWFGATAYGEWLSEKTGKSYRLPTEAEWEYAARAGTTTRYWWGDEDPVCQKGAGNGAKFDDDADCDNTGTEPVGFSAANPWGLYDVHGNVWEWSCSKFISDYDGSEKICEDKNDASPSRVVRGGSWGSKPRGLRSADRFWSTPDNRGSDLGFRLAQDRSL